MAAAAPLRGIRKGVSKAKSEGRRTAVAVEVRWAVVAMAMAMGRSERTAAAVVEKVTKVR
jgi:hypothetical protein